MTDELDRDTLARCADLLAQARHAVALAGAGMSKESGVPTFRGEGGLWTERGEPRHGWNAKFLKLKLMLMLMRIGCGSGCASKAGAEHGRIRDGARSR